MRENKIETLIVIVRDGLLLPSGFFAASSYTCNFFCRVPELWIADGRIGDIYLERLFEKVYGTGWRAGNSDASRYEIADCYSEVFAPDVVRNVDWSASENTADNHFWFYLTNENGEFRSVTAAEFQADIKREK